MPAIIIYGPQGCGKTLRAADMKAHYKATRVVDLDEQRYQAPRDGDVILTNDPAMLDRTSRYGVPCTAVRFEDFLAEAGLVEKHAKETGWRA
jgi:hypothetical protein